MQINKANPQMNSLQGKVAIITGAGGGIGAATALLMARRGARLLLADLHLEAAQRAAAAVVDDGGSAVAVHLDLGDPCSIEAMVCAAIGSYGRLDILHNNAADQDPQLTRRDGDVAHMEIEVWDRIFRVNVRGTMLACKAAIPHMLAQGGGAIINTASNLGLQGQVIQAAYSASKAAILQLTRSIAASHGRQGIRCNAVSPGLVLSPAARANLPPALLETVESETLTPYLGVPEDIAYAVAYAASDEARYLTGQNIVVDGGTSSHVPGFARFQEIFGAAP
jgi:NAD(P)-dependent dehydrogenase (short-subunit alcohol dehydrogenase family)